MQKQEKIYTVCYNCIDNLSLKKFIQEEATEKKCDVCSFESAKEIAITLNVLVKKVEQILSLYYVNADDIITSDNQSLPKDKFVYSENIFGLDDSEYFLGFPEKLKVQFKLIFSDFTWIKKSSLIMSDSEAFLMSWEYYVSLIKKEGRKALTSEPDFYEPQMLRLPDLFEELWKILEEEEMFEDIDSTKEIFRAREHSVDEVVENVKQIGTPEHKHVKTSNRFSSAGNPLFYGAFNKKISINEVNRNQSESRTVTVGTFKANKKIRVLNLANKIEEPGLYSTINYRKEGIIFINKFINIISQPIKEEDKEQDYLSTQVFTEYFRSKASKVGMNLKGFIYKSSKDFFNAEEPYNVVLFYSNEQCKDLKEIIEKDDDCLVLRDIEKEAQKNIY